ncbi:MAG: DUF1580 domain-containing protein [Thermoguttaceae bacterium]|jgi:hypothetical protein
MAIDITTETVIIPAKATHFCPERRRGVKPNPATIWRWMLQGVKVKGQPESEAIKLESLVVGGTRCTSIEALQRFFDALTAAADAEHSSAVTPPPVSKSRQKAIEAAERRLARAGI